VRQGRRRRIPGHGEAWALNVLGTILLDTGQPDGALIRHADALRLAAETGNRKLEADAHSGLGHAHQRVGDPATARRHWQQALSRYTELGSTEAAVIRAHLDTVPPGGRG
jgi:tetratricopeptide (TPR) repeat protein